MRHSLTVTLFITLILFNSCNKVFIPKSKDANIEYAKVQEILEVIQFAVAKAREEKPPGYSNAAMNDPDNLLYDKYFTGVEVEFANSFSMEVDSELSFWVVKGGATKSSKRATTFTYSFKPNTDSKVSANKDLDAKKEKAGKELIEALKKVGTCLKNYDGGNYRLSEVSIQVAFEVTTSTEAGAEFKIGVFGIGSTGSLEWDHGNSITLNFDLSSRP